MKRKRGEKLKKNIILRSHCKNAGVYLWELADGLKNSVETLQRKLRHEMTEEEQKSMIEVVDQISRSKGD